MKALINSLPAKDRNLLREVEADRMAELDEDEVLDLHRRIRRARNKQVTNYRRQAAAHVDEHGGRGHSYPKNTRARDRAEAYEDALVRVSERVAVLARQAADELKAERLAAARRGKGSGPDVPPPSAAPTPDGVVLPAAKTTGGLKKDASSRAEGDRRQAKKDNR